MQYCDILHGYVAHMICHDFSAIHHEHVDALQRQLQIMPVVHRMSLFFVLFVALLLSVPLCFAKGGCVPVSTVVLVTGAFCTVSNL